MKLLLSSRHSWEKLNVFKAGTVNNDRVTTDIENVRSDAMPPPIASPLPVKKYTYLAWIDLDLAKRYNIAHLWLWDYYHTMQSSSTLDEPKHTYSLLKDEKHQEEIREPMMKCAKEKFSWLNVAKQWDEKFKTNSLNKQI